ncbi:MAG: rhodanese-like domain-containing protein [Actinobacteria bacterium]|nr:rhodanese-like domain-containing protein [Actinomycetota bacterium]
MSEMVEMPRKDVPPPLELVKARIEEALPPDVRGQVEAGELALIDTREPDRFEKGRIAGAVNVPAGVNGVNSHSEDFAAAVADAAGEKPVLLYCGTGNRSARAADALVNEHGVAGARSLIGGIKLWDDLGFPVEGSVELADEDQPEEAED